MMNNNELKGKTALITGTAKRLGRAMALSLAKEGVNIIAHYNRSEKQCNLLLEELSSFNVKTWKLRGDLNESNEAERLFSRAGKAAGKIDILINNASIFPENPLIDFDLEDLFTNIRINSFSPFLLGRSFYKQEQKGDIINLLDTMILDYDKKHVPYHLSKQMLFSLTRMMAIEFAPAFRVNAIAPGIILPPEGKDDSYFESIKKSNPLENHGDPKDITRTLRFLLTSPFITGQVIYVDGGRHLKGRMYGS